MGDSAPIRHTFSRGSRHARTKFDRQRQSYGAGLALLDESGHVRALADIEAEAIRFAISHYGGQMSEVARRLHIGRSTLYRKLDSLGLDAEISDAKSSCGVMR
jgi:DNA-binding NtrC family response regulator